ncbi:MAG: T9SS type A sorting domain-containing protein [Acidobacteriota bacterium]
MTSFPLQKYRSSSLFVLLISFLIFNSNSLKAQQECGDCSNPRVALYDFAIKIPRPAETKAILKYLKLFFVGPFARSHVREPYPYGSCITWLDGAMINATELQGDTLRFGPETTNLPPAGTFEYADYILTGEVNGTIGNYTATISFEAAWSREVVASATVAFTDTSSDGSDPIDNAAIKLAAGISPLLKTIRDFELKKRNTDTKVAIRDKWTKTSIPEMEVLPSKKVVDTDETIDVEIKMIDCDGVPLKNREIKFTGTDYEGNPLEASTGGKFETASAMTDENGIAKAKFKAGSEKGTGVLRAYYVHEKPTGKPAIFIGTGIINIKQPPVEYYKISLSFTETRTFERDSSWDFYGMSGKSSDRISSIATGHLTAIMDNMSDQAGQFNFFHEVHPPITVSGGGNFSEIYNTKSFEYGLGALDVADVRSDNFSGNAVINKDIILSMDFNDTTDYFGITVGFSGEAISTGRHYGSPPDGGDVRWWNYGGPYDRGDAVFLGFDSKPGVYVSRSDTGYSVNWSNSETTEDSDGAHRTLRQNLSATISPYNMTTGVEELKRMGVPENYSLEQNYPNPFNPATKIRYSLPERTFVTLKVFDVLGSEVASLVNQEKAAGNYEVEFNASKLTSGVYIYKIQAGKYSSARKLLIMK